MLEIQWRGPLVELKLRWEVDFLQEDDRGLGIVLDPPGDRQRHLEDSIAWYHYSGEVGVQLPSFYTILELKLIFYNIWEQVYF